MTEGRCECGEGGRHRAPCPHSGRLRTRAVAPERTLARVLRPCAIQLSHVKRFGEGRGGKEGSSFDRSQTILRSMVWEGGGQTKKCDPPASLLPSQTVERGSTTVRAL